MTTTLLLLLLFCCYPNTIRTSKPSPETTPPTFESWKLLYNRTYRDEKEETARRQIYEDNRKFVLEESSLQLELGPFADLTHEEFLRTETTDKSEADVAEDEEVLIKRDGAMTCEIWKNTGGAAPSSINWKTKGAVTGILTQTRQCPGNSYAIAALGAVTGQWYQKSGRRIAFSEQQVVDCSQKNWK